VLTVPGAPLAFHVMAKPTGAVCNLDCEYCFFLSKEMLYPGSRFRMAADLQETYIRQLLEAHSRASEVVVAWQGGEPTMMGLDFFRRSIELERQYARPGQRILNTIQTNGTLLDDEWGEFLKEHGFLAGISIDGPPDMHDAYRVDKGGKPTFGRVMAGLDVLRRHQVDWNVLTTIHAVNADHGRVVYTFLRDGLGATFIQFIPIVERAAAQEHGREEAILALTDPVPEHSDEPQESDPGERDEVQCDGHRGSAPGVGEPCAGDRGTGRRRDLEQRQRHDQQHGKDDPGDRGGPRCPQRAPGPQRILAHQSLGHRPPCPAPRLTLGGPARGCHHPARVRREPARAAHHLGTFLGRSP
jgi:pyruvate-formate lyase-activating enzyme